MSLSDAASIDASNSGFGDSLGIVIDAAERVDLADGSFIGSTVLSNVNRVIPIEGGIVFIGARSLAMDNSEISASTSGLGNAGLVSITTEDTITATNSSSIRNLVEQTGRGNAGDLFVQTGTLDMESGSQLLSGVFRGFAGPGSGGQGNGGSIEVVANESVRLSGFVEETDPNGGVSRIPSGFLAQTEQNASGNAGGVTVTTPNLQIEDGAFISALTRNSSDAGSIELVVDDTLRLESGGAISVDGPVSDGQVLLDNPGDPGNIIITAGRIELINGGRLRAVTASGNNGNIILIAQDFVRMAGIQTSTDPSGSCSTCSEISTEAFGAGAQGGNILIFTGSGVFAELGENSDIVANAPGSNAGANILIGALNSSSSFVGASVFDEELGRTLESDLDASSTLTLLDGNVAVDASADPTTQDLPSNVVDSASLIDRQCELQASDTASEFTVVGRGGLPPDPSQPGTADTFLEDLGTVPDDAPAMPAQFRSPAPSEVTPLTTVREAQGWVQDENGQVYLFSGTSDNSARVAFA